jgi:hypothetical protein
MGELGDVRKMLAERGPECHGQHLGAAADPQDGPPLCSRGLHQGELESVPLRIHPLGLWVPGGAIAGGVDVSAPGQQHALHAFEARRGRLRRGDSGNITGSPPAAHTARR